MDSFTQKFNEIFNNAQENQFKKLLIPHNYPQFPCVLMPSSDWNDQILHQNHIN